jgi:GNAT superfamily N-acetyltransferase
VKVTVDGWLAEQLARDAFRVELTDEHPVEAAAGLPALIAHREAHPGAMYYARIATTAIDAVEALSRVGFYVVDVNVTLARTALALDRSPASPFTITDGGDGNAAGVLDIAGSVFRYSRFHLDPAIPIETAHRVKRSWVESYVQKSRGDRLFVAADARGAAAGFLAALVIRRDDVTAAVIDLMGVRTGLQRMGAGTALVAAFLRTYADRVGRYEVGTQAANVPSLRFYARFGFEIADTTYVLHMHSPGHRQDQ